MLFARYRADDLVLTVPAEARQPVSQLFAVSVEPPGIIHHLVQLLIFVLSWTHTKMSQLRPIEYNIYIYIAYTA